MKSFSVSSRSPFSGCVEQTYTNTGIAASWETVVTDQSFASLRVQKHLEKGWVSLILTEQGSRSAKTAMVTLSPEQAAKLRELLDLKD